jgi:hypothetical protein
MRGAGQLRSACVRWKCSQLKSQTRTTDKHHEPKNRNDSSASAGVAARSEEVCPTHVPVLLPGTLTTTLLCSYTDAGLRQRERGAFQGRGSLLGG